MTLGRWLRRSTPLVMVVALLALGAAWTVRPQHGVPLYDGVGFPDEPYRYIDPPSGSKHTAAPATATASSDVSGTTNGHPFYANSSEIGPQIAVFIAGGALLVDNAAAGTKPATIDLQAVPLAPDRQPDGATVDGNVYRISASSQGSPVGAAPSGVGESTVTMRATSARQPKPVFVYRETPTAAWRSLGSARIGNDVYRTAFAGFGDYALAFVAGSSKHAGGTPGSVFVLAGLVFALLVVVLAIRLSRRRRADVT